MMTQILALALLIACVVGFGLFKWWQVKRTIEQVLKTNAELTDVNKQQTVKIQTQQAEISNAQIQRKHSQAVQRSSIAAVDNQLHQHGWFRDDGCGVRVSGVPKNLSKSLRHDGDQASDTDSQSDSSGDVQ